MEGDNPLSYTGQPSVRASDPMHHLELGGSLAIIASSEAFLPVLW